MKDVFLHDTNMFSHICILESYILYSVMFSYDPLTWYDQYVGLHDLFKRMSVVSSFV